MSALRLRFLSLCIAFAMFALGGLATSRANAAPPDGNKLVKFKLVTSASVLAPGQQGWLGVVFDIEPGWHIYWRNPGDSGVAPGVTFDAPSGVTIGEAQWPTPERHVSEGLVDFIYTGKTMLLFPVTLDSGAKVGGSLTISAHVSWMVCQNVCVGGEGDGKLSLSIASQSKPSPDSPLVDRFLALVPKPLKSPADSVAASWNAGALILKAPGAQQITWMPYEYESVPRGPVDILNDGVSATGELRVPYGAAAKEEPMIRGVVQVRRKDQTTSYVVEVPPKSS
ncbi:MAG TPA: protein-disulfide reductase DsbD domain-containing protein [Phycisphaerales bacterium]|nr:protein-disulfide reductase DsbD domain-containing protein [Phycisphaerales bacterium]